MEARKFDSMKRAGGRNSSVEPLGTMICLQMSAMSKDYIVKRKPPPHRTPSPPRFHRAAADAAFDSRFSAIVSTFQLTARWYMVFFRASRLFDSLYLVFTLKMLV